MQAQNTQSTLNLEGQCITFKDCVCALVAQSVFSDSAIPWTVALQAPLFIEFSRQEYWSGKPYTSPGDLPNPGIKPRSPALQANFLLLSHQGNSYFKDHYLSFILEMIPMNSFFLPEKCPLWLHFLSILLATTDNIIPGKAIVIQLLISFLCKYRQRL